MHAVVQKNIHPDMVPNDTEKLDSQEKEPLEDRLHGAGNLQAVYSSRPREQTAQGQPSFRSLT